MGQRKDISRRSFLRSGVSLAGAAILGYGNTWIESGELLYNGIRLPTEWPPGNMKADDYEPMPLPYLTSPPDVIPIDIERQLFIDDFLIELEAPKGQLIVLICDKQGNPLPGFGREQCMPVSGDSTKQLISWKGNHNLTSLKGIPVRLKFYLINARIYSFWMSKHPDGRSAGATAGGGPGLNGYWDV